MKERSVIIALLIVAMTLIATVSSARAWEYFDTRVDDPRTDNVSEAFGPRSDKIKIHLYDNYVQEYNALETGEIDVLDYPVDSDHYVPWTTDPPEGLQDKIAVVDTGSEFGMFILDMRMDNRSEIAPGIPNPAYNTQHGNPMADVWLRRAIACIADRNYTVDYIVSGGHPPSLASALYTPLSDAYAKWTHPDIKPTGTLAEWCYVLANGSYNIIQANEYLDTHGYVYDPVQNCRLKDGYKFTIDLYYRSDHTARQRFATEVIQYLMQAAPPNGLGMRNNLVLRPNLSAASRGEVMVYKKGHLYTGGWSLTQDPDHLYYLFHVDNYWNPGRPPNYMYYPGDSDKFVVASDGWRYTGFPEKYGWESSGLNFSDPDKDYKIGDVIWTNPCNYWSWEMMIATNYSRALYASLRCQEFLAFYVCGVPLWASKSYSAFYRTYVGSETAYLGQPWKGVVNQKGVGVWGATSFYNMHTANANWGDGTMTINWGFSEPIISLNPIYADYVSDWNALKLVYGSLTEVNPYTLEDSSSLACNWETGTWDASALGLGVCTKITFNLRHDVKWSDGMLFTASDVKFTWGGPLVTGSISNLLEKKGYPPTYWSSNIADILSIATPDPWTVVAYLDVHSYFSVHSMSGWNIVLPEHVWKPIIESGDPTNPWNQPCICTGPYIIPNTTNPASTGYLTLEKNLLFHEIQSGTRTPTPVEIIAIQTSNASERIGDTHWIKPKSGETGIDLTVDISMHTSYAYETGPNQTQVYPYTRLDGLKNVTLWIWNGTGCPNQLENYELFKTIATDVPWTLQRSIWEQQHYEVLSLRPWWYLVQIDVQIESLEYSPDNGTTWIQISSTDNPFYHLAYSRREWTIITSRYDIGGKLFKPCPNPKYQPISDLTVDIKDLYACAKAYATTPGYPNWNAACDVNNDYKVDVKDYYKIAQNYGWTLQYPG